MCFLYKKEMISKINLLLKIVSLKNWSVSKEHFLSKIHESEEL